MRKYYTLADITERITLALPVRFTKEQSSNVYKFFESLSDSFKIDTDKIDELIAQTNLSSASGDYLDQYISGLIGVGRLKDSVQDVLATEEAIEISDEEDDLFLMPGYQAGAKESDPAYKDRYNSILYRYNSTMEGIKQIVVDFLFEEPEEIYAGSKRGVFYSSETAHSKFFFNDVGRSYYGSANTEAFVGFIQLKERPDEALIEQLCIHIENAKAYGIKVCIKYPLVGIADGKYVYNFQEQVIAAQSLSTNQTTQSENVTATDSLSYIIINV
jgi:hypothetical protein